MNSPMNRFSIQIADITCAVVSADPTLQFSIETPIRNFLAKAEDPEITIKARMGDLSDFQSGGVMIFDSGSVWRLYRNGKLYTFSFRSEVFGVTPYKIAKIQKDFAKGDVLIHRPFFGSDTPIYPLDYPLDELLFINYLSHGKGAEVHACGLVDAVGNGHLFVGQSGAGKTTTARLWEAEPGVIILSDDRIILRKIDNTVYMYGTPWHGEAGFAAPVRTPLMGIYFLQKAAQNELIPLNKINSTGRLFSCSFLPFYSPQGLEFVLTFFERVARTVPCFEFRFVPDRTAVECLLRTQG